MSNPVVQEAFSVYGSGYEFRRAHVLTVAIAVAALLVLWPGESFTSYYSFGDQPVVFPVTVTLFPLAVGLLSGMIGLNAIGRGSFITELEWVRRTPLSVSELVTGKALVAAAHSGVLVLLLAPVLVVSGTVSGASLGAALYALLLFATFTLLCRFLGLGLTGLFPRRRYIAVSIFWLVYLAMAFPAINRLPVFHPAVAVLGSPGESGTWYGELPLWHAPWHTAALHLAAALLFLVLYGCGILLIERRTRRHAR